MRILFLFLGLATTLAPAKNSFSTRAWKRIAPIYQKIKAHPFNQELVLGTLSTERFKEYKNQDALYLKEYSKALALLAAKIEDRKLSEKVLEFSKDALAEGSEFTGEKNLANLAYTQFLLATATLKTGPELAAALLPCFWIYLELGKEMKPLTKKNNPYFSWVSSYSSPKYEDSVRAMIQITDELARPLSEKELARLFHAFETAAKLEWFFWEATYHERRFYLGSINFPGFSKFSGSKTDLIP